MDGDAYDSQTGEIEIADRKLRHWDELSRTDPAHTKRFERAGGFKGTAIRPIWNQYRLTAHFGPCGIGWGFKKPEYQIVQGTEEQMVYCTVECWYKDDNGENATIFGVGGDKVTAKQQRGPFNDDEAFKKALTDAIGNAFLRVGLSADVHMGLFEDSKYVQETRRHFAAAEERDLNPFMDNQERQAAERPNAARTAQRSSPAAPTGRGRPQAAPAPSDAEAKATQLYQALKRRIDEAVTVKGLETIVPSQEWKTLDDALHAIRPADVADTSMGLLRDRIEAQRQYLLGGTG